MGRLQTTYYDNRFYVRIFPQQGLEARIASCSGLEAARRVETEAAPLCAPRQRLFGDGTDHAVLGGQQQPAEQAALLIRLGLQNEPSSK